ncbi:hypothetical protein BHM03_00022755 [Ensete ventricosum]|nr:hypothetical protein BHM03_00022755 [Ensete ventricosum]
MARPPARGRPAAAKAPYKGATGCGQAPCKGQPPAGAATRGHDLLRPACKGLKPAARSQGATARDTPARGAVASDQPTASPAACVGAMAVAVQWATRRGLGHPFEKRMILPL